ncbi:MAG: hypothetical protein LQ351_000356 [Letrouitia transgressa]|nr:MAG: hypothetical protein LQ351_000356 [Letrouitia transgressa]
MGAFIGAVEAGAHAIETDVHLTKDDIDNNANDIMRLIAQTIHDVPPHPAKPWAKRIVLGCWAAKFFPLCAQHLPAFPIAHIGFSGSYARQFLPLPNISFNILQKSVFGPSGRRLLRDVKAAGRPIYFWTVNGESMMRWSIAKEADGVITDDPKRFLEVCDEWEHGKRDVAIARGEWVTIIWLNLMVVIFSAIFWWRYGSLKGQQRKDAAKEVGEKKEEKKKGGKPGVSAIEHEEDQ